LLTSSFFLLPLSFSKTRTPDAFTTSGVLVKKEEEGAITPFGYCLVSIMYTDVGYTLDFLSADRTSRVLAVSLSI
jgi:hypothetical protein